MILAKRPSFPGGPDGKESACNAADLGSIPRLGRSLGEGNDDPLPVFLPGELRGQKSLVGYSPWGRKESDMTERPTLLFKSSHKIAIIAISSFSP